MRTMKFCLFLFILIGVNHASARNAEQIQHKRPASDECGLSIDPDKFTTLIAGGSPTRQGQFPWLTAVYHKDKDNRWKQSCGGALLSPQLVLTVAHCLVHHSSGPIKPEDIKVGLGKYQRDYYTFENDSIIADVKELVTPKNYNGQASGYAVDIGLVVLKEKVRFTPYIRPVCLDWTSVTPQTGDIGHFAGRGVTEKGISSETVLSAKLTYKFSADCLKDLQPIYYKFVTADKFCAGGSNGTNANKGDTGGALTMVQGERHYLVGALSSKLTSTNTSNTLFTDVLHPQHKQWLMKWLGEEKVE